MSVVKAYIVPGQPHVLLAAEKSPAWQSLKKSYDLVRQDIEKQNADYILYFSTQWLSVIGYMFQADPLPTWNHVDANWHEFGSIDYKFKTDLQFAQIYHDEVKKLGHTTKLINYHGFPMDTGTIVAQKLLNPNNKLPMGIISCNMYAEKQESLSIGQAAIRAIQKYGKKVVVVAVTGLSNRFFVEDINPKEDRISSLKDDEWNRKVLELLGEGRLEDVSEVGREFSKQANADLGFKAFWWLNGLCGKTNEFTGQVFDYQPVWGTGAALVGLTPKKPVRPIPGWREEEYDLTAGTALVGGTEKKAAPTKSEELAESKAEILVHSQKAPEPVGPYPHARQIGDLLYVSGIGPRQRGSKKIPGVELNDKGEILSYDVAVQTRSVIENIRSILQEAGLDLSHIIDVQAFLTDMKKDFSTFNKIYGEYFSAADGPTRTTVEVGALPTPIAVELKVIARLN